MDFRGIPRGGGKVGSQSLTQVSPLGLPVRDRCRETTRSLNKQGEKMMSRLSWVCGVEMNEERCRGSVVGTVEFVDVVT